MSFSVFSLPIQSTIKASLKENHFVLLKDLQNVSTLRLSQITNLPVNVCCDIVTAVDHISNPLQTISAFEFRNQELSEEMLPITTLSKKIDDFFGGGFPLRKVIEVYGEARTGKTHLCMQLCVNVQIPKCLGGKESEALFIDCEHFNCSRFDEIASLTIADLKSKWRQINEDIPATLHVFTKKHVMDKLHVVPHSQCDTAQKLRNAILMKLETFLDEHPKVRLVVIDSITYYFRYGCEYNNLEKTKILLEISHKLKQLAFTRNLCIITTNQVTYNPKEEENIAALGRSWAHCCDISIRLERDESGKRYLSTRKYFPGKRKFAFALQGNGFRAID